MRKIVVYNVVSLDGYHTGVGNDVKVMFPMMGDTFNTYNAELLRTADVQLMGRVSFELFQSFWPKVTENPDAYSDSERELSQAGKSVKGVVVSDTVEGNWQGLRIIRQRDAHKQITELKRQAGQDILITGSRTLSCGTICWPMTWWMRSICWLATASWGRVCWYSPTRRPPRCGSSKPAGGKTPTASSCAMRSFTKAWKGRHHEIFAHVRRHTEPEHPQRAGRPIRQTDCRVQRSLYPHWDLPFPWRSFILWAGRRHA